MKFEPYKRHSKRRPISGTSENHRNRELQEMKTRVVQMSLNFTYHREYYNWNVTFGEEVKGVSVQPKLLSNAHYDWLERYGAAKK